MRLVMQVMRQETSSPPLPLSNRQAISHCIEKTARKLELLDREEKESPGPRMPSATVHWLESPGLPAAEGQVAAGEGPNAPQLPA